MKLRAMGPLLCPAGHGLGSFYEAIPLLTAVLGAVRWLLSHVDTRYDPLRRLSSPGLHLAKENGRLRDLRELAFFRATSRNSY